jgi:hypothetical protein
VKINPDKLRIDPEPERRPGATYARSRARALRAWRRGELVLVVMRPNGTRISPDEVDWSALPPESARPGGRHSRAPRSVRLSAERETRLSALAGRWGVSENEAVGRAIDEAFSSEPPKSDA